MSGHTPLDDTLVRAGADRLAIKLTLTPATGSAVTVTPGDVKRCELHLYSWGFDGSVEFYQADNQAQGGEEQDTLLAAFQQPAAFTLTLSLQAVYPDEEVTGTVTPITLTALVRERAVVEHVYRGVDQQPVLYRLYTVRFSDAAQLLWRQHYPCQLFTSTTMQSVFDALKGDDITIAYDWSAALSAQLPMVFVGLDRRVGFPGASFYDFVMWYTWNGNGVFSYDYTQQQYSLAATRPSGGTALSILPVDVGRIAIEWPEVPRYDVNVLNAVAVGSSTQPATNQYAATGIRQDVLMRTPIANDVTTRVTAETTRLTPCGQEARVAFTRLPSLPFMPGGLVQLAASDGWSATPLSTTAGTWRAVEVHLTAAAERPAPDGDHNAPHAGYHVSVEARLETQAETCVRLPPFTTPVYPRHVEGTIVSETGDDTQLTYQIYTDQTTSLDNYTVAIPLWNLQVTAPFNPNMQPGTFYFPAYKGERVLLALDFSRAWIKRFLDWRPGAQLPAETQGMQLLLGKTDQTTSTALSNYYQGDVSVFSIVRSDAQNLQTFKCTATSMLLQCEQSQSSGGSGGGTGGTSGGGA